MYFLDEMALFSSICWSIFSIVIFIRCEIINFCGKNKGKYGVFCLCVKKYRISVIFYYELLLCYAYLCGNNRLKAIKLNNMKTKLLASMLVFGAMNASAQLTVYHNGNVNIGSEQPTSNVSLSVGNVAYRDTAYHVSLGLHNPASGCYNIGGEGVAYSPTMRNTGRAFGLRGVAGNCTSGYNFGVLGALQGSQEGAAIFGTTSGKTLGLSVDGRYAGYFDGNVKITGSLQGDVVNSADVNAKNTQALRPINSALDGIASANPFMYIVRTQVPDIGAGMAPDSTTQTGTVAPTSDPVVPFGKSYYALDVNAVKQSFPALIIKDAKGNEYVNYTQLVPILVQAIKELKTELDDLKEAVASSGTRKVNAATNIATNTLDEGWGSISQNTPNPFTGQSTVRVSVPDDASDAYVDILTLNGASVKRIPVSNGLSEVSLSSFDFVPGTYLYTLVVNGKVTETRRMIVNR